MPGSIPHSNSTNGVAKLLCSLMPYPSRLSGIQRHFTLGSLADDAVYGAMLFTMWKRAFTAPRSRKRTPAASSRPAPVAPSQVPARECPHETRDRALAARRHDIRGLQSQPRLPHAHRTLTDRASGVSRFRRQRQHADLFHDRDSAIRSLPANGCRPPRSPGKRAQSARSPGSATMAR